MDTTAQPQPEKEWIHILRYVSILHDKGISIDLDSVCRGLSIGSLDAKRDEKGEWFISKADMLRRLRNHDGKLLAIKAGYYSIPGFVYQLSIHGIGLSTDQICHQLSYGLLVGTQDAYGRIIIPASELDNMIARFSFLKN